MGDEFKATKQLPITVKARGTRTVARVEIIKDSQIVYTTEPKQKTVEFNYLDKGDATQRHYVRLMQDDGMIAWSSPFFVNYR
jgi:hypothetical protein